MQKMFLTLTKIALATVAGVSFSAFAIAQPTFAQLGTTDSTTSDPSQNNSDPFSRNGGTEFNMFNLIHQANFGTLNWNAEQQNQQLDEAALLFRKRQQQAIQNGGNVGTASQNSPIIRLPENTVQPLVPAKN
ncbi:hypothetical protein NIES22_09370 [Calothrix brevissima NIES-22]|nr:hypothetical protein NIES22_09370 [Calothrix brevissima NIES-22]